MHNTDTLPCRFGVRINSEGFTVCLFLKEFLETEPNKINFIFTEEFPGRKQKAGKMRKVQGMTEGILKVI